MRDAIFACMLVPLILMSFRSGYVAYLLWGWAGLISIQSYLYGFMIGVGYAQLFAIIALIGFLVKQDLERRSFTLNSTSILFALFSLHIALSALFSFSGHPRNWEMTSNMFKTVLFCLLMPMLVTSRFRIHALILVLVLATGFHGIIDGLKFVASAGNHRAVGIAKFGDNNHFAMVLIMIIPLIAYISQNTKKNSIKMAFFSMLPLNVFAVIATQSRGGLVSLAVVGAWFFLTSRRKVSVFVVLVLCIFLAINFAPEHWMQRMQTIDKAGEDSSFLGRVGAWQVSTAIALRNPFFGAGPMAIEMGSVWGDFKNASGLLGFLPMDLDGLAGRGRATHSIYFQALGDLGFVGLFIFVAILINAFLIAHNTIKICIKNGPQYEWAGSLAKMLTLTLIAYCVGGSLLSALYFELPYIIAMILQVLLLQVEFDINKSKNRIN